MQAQQRIDLDLDDLFRGLRRHLFDIHAARLAGHDHDAGAGTVREHAEVQLFVDLQPLFHQHLAHQSAFRTGLVGHQRHAQDASGHIPHFQRRFGQLDAPALAASTGVNLGFDHHRKGLQHRGSLHRLVHTEAHLAARNGYAILLEQFFRLIFVNLHLPLSVANSKIILAV